MTKKNSKFFKLTLTQQLIGIILLFVVVFLSFFFIYLNNHINSFVRLDMESVLNSSHMQVQDSYLRNNGGSFLTYENDDNVAHKIWSKYGTFQTESYRYLPTTVSNDINGIIQQLLIQPSLTLIHETAELEAGYLVEVTIDGLNGYTIVSVISNDYSDQLRNNLINGILNAVFLIVSLLFALMLAWVTSIIRSLGKIKDYVSNVTNDHHMELDVERYDEIGDVAKSIVYMNEELERQEQVKAELIQNISHDLKTPIATIKSYGESIKDGIYPYDTLEKSVDVIIEHASRLEDKVHSLLLLNRMDYLVSNNDGSTVDLEEIVNKTLVSIIPVNSELEIIVDSEPSMFVGEEESWRVVCENILDNALRYAQTYIKITLKEDYISFENDGESLTEEVISTMFKPYEKGTDGGFGMGLSIVFRVVSAYGYNVYAENTKDGVIIRIDKSAQL